MCADWHKTPPRWAKGQTALDGQTPERSEFNDLCTLRRFTPGMPGGSPRNPQLDIKPPPDVRVKKIEGKVVGQFDVEAALRRHLAM
jgi:hypothetical protein